MKKHLKSIAASNLLAYRRKNRKYVTRPSPGPHGVKKCVTLNALLRDMLNYAKTTKEAKKILDCGDVIINGSVRKDHKFPIGIMDVIAIKKEDKHYRLLYGKGGKFELKHITKEEAHTVPYKVIGKKILKDKKIQLNLYGGKNILVNDNKYCTGDTVLLDNTNKITSHLKLEKGATVYILGGKHVGVKATLEGIHKYGKLQPDRISLKKDKDTFETLKEYAFVVDKSFTI